MMLCLREMVIISHLRVKLHHPSVFPHSQLVDIRLEDLFVLSLRTAMYQCVVSEEACCRSQLFCDIVYVIKKQTGPKDWTLGDSRHDQYFAGWYTINNNRLSAICELAIQVLTLPTNPYHFNFSTRRNWPSFEEIKDADIWLVPVLHIADDIVNKFQKRCLTWPAVSEAMLDRVKDVVMADVIH